MSDRDPELVAAVNLVAEAFLGLASRAVPPVSPGERTLGDVAPDPDVSRWWCLGCQAVTLAGMGPDTPISAILSDLRKPNGRLRTRACFDAHTLTAFRSYLESEDAYRGE